MRVRFSITLGKDAGVSRTFDLEEAASIVVGRADDCDFPLWDETASRRHASVELSPDGATLVDLGSANGTSVNGERVSRHALAGGEVIRIGETEFVVETEGFQRRATVVLRPPEEEDFTIETSLSPEAVDLGGSIAADPGKGDRLNQLLRFVDEVQDAEGGEEILRALIRHVTQVAPAERAAAIPCASRSLEPLWLEAIVHPQVCSDAAPTELAISRSLVRRTVSEGNALCVSDAATDPRTRSRDSIIGRRVGSIASVPIAARARIHGILYLEATAGDGHRDALGFDEEDLTYLATLGQIAGMALHNAERLQQSRRLLRTREGKGSGFRILTRSKAFEKTLELVARFAASGGPVLIAGDTGTGKELLARHAHLEGSFQGGPWIPVNCAAIPESLLESELFGHEKGAFTGATGRKAGMFELAHQGTLFLDEIGDMPVELQPKLLRVLETGEFFRIGGRSPVSVELLVVSATHHNLENRVAERAFREDLLFRLGRFRVDVPPLRSRPEDIVLLAEHFLEAVVRRSGALTRSLSSEAMEVLVAYPWPGNVRELQNVIERAALVAAESSIRPSDLALPAGSPLPTRELSERQETAPGVCPPSLAEVEEAAIRRALRHTGGRKGDAATILGIAWPTLRRKLRKYEIDSENP